MKHLLCVGVVALSTVCGVSGAKAAWLSGRDYLQLNASTRVHVTMAAVTGVMAGMILVGRDEKAKQLSSCLERWSDRETEEVLTAYLIKHPEESQHELGFISVIAVMKACEGRSRD